MCSNPNCVEILTLFVSIFALIAAICIPRRIMINQIYADLMSQYRSPEMGGAILSIFHFFKENCKCDISRIESEYKKIYEEQIKNKLPVENGKTEKIDFTQTLHFQRRLVAQFYFNMASLRYNNCIIKLPKKYMDIWFTSGEVKLLSIILHMAKAADKVFIDVGKVPYPKEDETQMNQLIYKLYEEVSECV